MGISAGEEISLSSTGHYYYNVFINCHVYINLPCHWVLYKYLNSSLKV